MSEILTCGSVFYLYVFNESLSAHTGREAFLQYHQITEKRQLFRKIPAHYCHAICHDNNAQAQAVHSPILTVKCVFQARNVPFRIARTYMLLLRPV